MFSVYSISTRGLTPPQVFVLFGLFLVFITFLPRLFTPFTPTNRGFSPSNLPKMFLVLALVLGGLALFTPASRRLSTAGENDLRSFSGIVQQVPTREGDGLIRIRVATSDGEHDLFVEDLSHLQEIMDLRPGDSITARAQSWLGELHVWELQHDGATIESYQETRQFSDRALQHGQASALWAGLVASIFLIVAIVLRLCFGVWSQPVEKSVLGSPIVPPEDSP